MKTPIGELIIAYLIVWFLMVGGFAVGWVLQEDSEPNINEINQEKVCSNESQRMGKV